MKKIIIIITGIFFLFVIGFLFIAYEELTYPEDISEIYDHDPAMFELKKPIDHLDFQQRDSLKSLKVTSAKIEVSGTGYTGYNFYMWHKPTEKGELYIKGFELTDNQQISEMKLRERTTNKIDTVAETYFLFEGSTTIDEGTFGKFYPVRFELWFNPENGNERKLTEKQYLIDGWDR